MPDAVPPLPVRVLLDAHAQFLRVAQAIPEAVRDDPRPPLNTPGFTVAHVAWIEDRGWNVAAQGLEPDPFLAALDLRFGADPSAPPFSDALAAYQRVIERSQSCLRALTESDYSRVLVPARGDRPARTVENSLARSGAHLFAHAGELATIASLAGVPDLGLPGRMENVG